MNVRLHPLIPGILISLAFTCILNAASVNSWIRGTLNVAELGAALGSADEVYYFALIRDARDGHFSMGNSSFAQYADAPSMTGYALLPQGILAALTPLELPTIILFGDLFSSFFLSLLFYLVARCVFGGVVLPSLFTSSFLFWWEASVLRTMNPQVTMFFFTLATLLFFADSEVRHPWRRGCSILGCVLVQPILAVLLLAIQGLDFLVQLFRQRSLKLVWKFSPILLLPVLGGLAQWWWVSSHSDPSIIADLSARRGLILSYLPSDPRTTILLFLLGIAWMVRRFAFKDFSRSSEQMLVCMLAGIFVLHQQVLHGHEAIFGLYYRLSLTFLIALSAGVLVYRFLGFRISALLFSLVMLWHAPSFVSAISLHTHRASEARNELAASGIPEILSALDELEGSRVVLAPIEVSNLVPVSTRHTALFTPYARFEYVSDRELALRYLVQQYFFELPAELVLEGHPLVFGLSAGNLYARSKIVCSLQRFINTESSSCGSQQLPDFIRHQDVRELVEHPNIEPLTLLRTFAVDTLVTDKQLHPLLKEYCNSRVAVGTYQIYTCSF